MDCAAEENLVRMKLDGVPTIRRLVFDLAERSLTVYHEGTHEPIEKALDALALGSRLVETKEAFGAEEISQEAPQAANERTVLWTVLVVNFAFFAIEVTTGLISGSMGLVADSLDMLADAIVYGLSLMVVGASVGRKKTVASASGYFQLTLAVVGFIEVIRRFVGIEEPPDFETMIIVSGLALVANGVSLYLLQRARSDEVHMKASLIFTSNDIIINIGVILAGVLVSWLDSSLPDLFIGAIVFLIVMRGAVRILRLAPPHDANR